MYAVIETGAGELRYARFERPQDLALLRRTVAALLAEDGG